MIVTNSEFTGIIGDGPFGQGIMMVGNGSLSVTDSTFTGSTTGISLSGNGSSQGSATVANSTFVGNDAGRTGTAAASTTRRTLTVTNSTFSGNSAGGFGGGISNAGGTLTVTNSTFSGNSADARCGRRRHLQLR